MPKNKDKLNRKQRLFCEEYIKTLNATKSYMEVYKCSKKSAETQGSRLLQKVEIKEYIEERLNNVEKSKIADANEILEFLTSVARGEVKDQLGFETSVKDRIKASELLAKRYKLFDDKKDTPEGGEEKQTPKIEIQIVDNSDLEKVMYDNKDN